ncbi:sorbitol dehydrogenase [Peptococcaceae bacterium CEB3]|nr:sorbitol dehydrogenase [Peptococcaceae bacterium CEB3]
MGQQMMVADLVSDAKIELETIPVPELNDDEVLVSVHTCGICGSDMHAYHGKHPYVAFPIIMGHEFSGIVVATGSQKYDNLKEQRIVVEPSIVCGDCYNCRHGRYNICQRLAVLGCQTSGAFAEYIKVPGTQVIVLPDSVSFAEAAMVEPLAVGVHAARRARLQSGDRVVVLGAGTIGLLTAASAAQLGAEVLIVDMFPAKLEVAKKLKIQHTINLAEQDLAATVTEVFGDEGPDVWFECVGIEKTIHGAITLARNGTKIIVVGVFGQTIQVDMGLVQTKELELLGSLMYTRGDFDTALDFIRTKNIDVSKLISAVYPVSKLSEAFKAIEANRGTSLKTLITVKGGF